MVVLEEPEQAGCVIEWMLLGYGACVMGCMIPDFKGNGGLCWMWFAGEPAG